MASGYMYNYDCVGTLHIVLGDKEKLLTFWQEETNQLATVSLNQIVTL